MIIDYDHYHSEDDNDDGDAADDNDDDKVLDSRNSPALLKV